MMTRWLASAMMVSLVGCGTSTYECSESKACPLGSDCVDGSCVSQGCATSDQCGIEQYCDTNNKCASGCLLDTDCKYGEYCDTEAAQCASAECSDTRTDCAFNEFCNPTGECYDAGGYYCHDCETDTDCGGNGNICYSGYCSVTCESDEDCPQGYDCVGFSDISGNIVAYGCFTSCWLYGL